MVNWNGLGEGLAPRAGAPALKCSKLTRRFRREDAKRPGFLRRRPLFAALDAIDFEVRPREIFGLIGMNGSGKSTLVRVISTLLEPDEGTIEVFGFDSRREGGAVRQLINRVSVDAPFFKALSARENLRYGARLYGLTTADARGRYEQLLRRIGMEPKVLGDRMSSLSRGMRQKVAVARAFMTAPALMLLDEPTTGLDPRSKREVQRVIREIRDTEGTTVVLTTHDMDEADRLCDRLAIIHEGRFVATGTPDELRKRAGDGEAVASLERAFFKFTGSSWFAEENGD